MADIFVSTSPFGEVDPTPIKMLKNLGIDFAVTDNKSVLSEKETIQKLRGVKYLIAGTERLSAETLLACPDLKLISRVGIGLDSIDLDATRRLGIKVAYTPDGPTGAVIELTIGFMIDQMRGISHTDRNLRKGVWSRRFGSRLHDTCFGIIGAGRIGSGLIKLLVKMGAMNVLYYDIDDSIKFDLGPAVSFVDRETLLKESDIVSLHVPLMTSTRNCISKAELSMMKRNASIINTSRGGIVDEDALYAALSSGGLRSAAVDVFAEEPYQGPLAKCENCTLTAHMGSMSYDCRANMEIEATENLIRFINGEPDYGQVPNSEYPA